MLDNTKKIKDLDPGGMIDHLRNFPQQIITGRELAENAPLGAIDTSRVRNIVVCGMGGSAIGGDLVKSYAIDLLEVPIYINRDYSLPAFVDEKSLVIGSSYSGNTEETLQSFAEAGKRGAQRAVITTGGKISEIAERESLPIIRIPGGLPPRAALGYSFAPMLTLLERLGFIPDQNQEVEDTFQLLQAGISEYDLDSPAKDNAAKTLAFGLFKKLPLIYSDSFHFESVAVRFRGQINENAKQLAYSALLPENNHNELVGWHNVGYLKDTLVAIWLKAPDIHQRVGFRMSFMENVQAELGVESIILEAIGETLLSRMFSLIQLGDWASYYLAILNEIDPMPVKIIDKLKSELASR